ncbi:MAG: DNA-directed polymerase sigma-70 factor [Myxococcaceae bacterium]|nr:DNA-directed polymerase sigma-70 factor [Myxococcaceae bacterium]
MSTDTYRSDAAIVARALRRWARTTQCVPPDDLRQIAWEALLGCRRRYDATGGATFETYALDTIRFVFFTASRLARRITRLGMQCPASVERYVRRASQAGRVVPAMLRAQFPWLRAYDDDDLEHVAAWCLAGDASLDAPAGDEGTTRGEQLAVEGADAVEGARIAADASRVADDLCAGLSPMEAAVLRGRLLADEPATFAVLGAAFGVSKQRVQHVEARLTQKLRAAMLGGHPWLECLRPSQRAAIRRAAESTGGAGAPR